MSDDLSNVEVPDRVGLIHNWRCWAVVESPKGEVWLGSCNHAHLWVPREPNVASCPRSADACAVSPGPCGGCGIYAARTPEEALSYVTSKGCGEYTGAGWKYHDTFIGVLAQWGLVEEGSNATRSQFAYPSGLVVPSHQLDLAARLVDRYGMKILTTELSDEFYTLRDHPEQVKAGKVSVEFKEVMESTPEQETTKWTSKPAE